MSVSHEGQTAPPVAGARGPRPVHQEPVREAGPVPAIVALVAFPLSYLKDKSQMVNVQDREDARRVAIDQVGYSGFDYPVQIVSRGVLQHTVATYSLGVSLAPNVKGTHMSRFAQFVSTTVDPVTPLTLPLMLERLLQLQRTEWGRIVLRFPLFLERAAPISGATARQPYECGYEVRGSGEADAEIRLLVRVPVTTLCPCSKEISDYGAHNQRGYLTLRVILAPSAPLDLEALIELAESCGSCPVFPLLKREDERAVTMAAYDKPVFVEDMVRDVAVALRSDRDVLGWHVRAENVESIHAHQAYASIAGGLPILD